MYKIKQTPEDFIVTEINNVKIQDGAYTYFVLKKKNQTTLHAIQEISRRTGIPLREFGYAGNKDKNAITEQTCSVRGNIRIEGMIGTGKTPISLGQHNGNRFAIIVRNITEKPKIHTEFVNYYGEQRFGTRNAELGKLILLGKWNEAAEKLVMTKEEFKQQPLKLLKLYVNAYQSLLWNKMASECTHDEAPVIGFGTEETDEVRKVLSEEGITLRNFIVKELTHLSAEGQMRKRLATAKDLKVGELEDDELNTGMKKITLEFTLEPGSYATEFIRQNFESN